MSTTYPTSKKTFTDHVDNDAGDFIDAADINDVHDTVEAMETVLGGDFQGAIKNINIDAAAAIAISKTALETFTDWTDYTPTFSGAGGTAGTFAITGAYGRYCQIGKLVTFHFRCTITNKGSWSGALYVDLPVATAAGISVELALTGFMCANTGNPVTFSRGVPVIDHTTKKIAFEVATGTTYVDFTTAQVNDAVVVSGSYEVA